VKKKKKQEKMQIDINHTQEGIRHKPTGQGMGDKKMK
jgi:hypothetical protein